MLIQLYDCLNIILWYNILEAISWPKFYYHTALIQNPLTLQHEQNTININMPSIQRLIKTLFYYYRTNYLNKYHVLQL